MATQTIKDLRRTDLRVGYGTEPFWITSAILDASAYTVKAQANIFFSFPTVQKIFVEQVVCQIITAFSANTTIDIGTGTLATDDVTTAGDMTVVDADEYIKNSDITIGTPGYYGSLTATTSDWLAAKILGSFVAPYMITGAATTVPVIWADINNAGAIAAGKMRVHALISVVPGY